jgi:hypothetical protein
LNGSFASPELYVNPIWIAGDNHSEGPPEKSRDLPSIYGAEIREIFSGIAYWWNLIPWPVKSLVATTMAVLLAAIFIYFAVSCLIKPFRHLFERTCLCCH